MKPTDLLGYGEGKTDKSFEFTADFLAGIFTWGGVGWGLDHLLGTGPVLMLIGFVVGNMAGLYLLYLRSQDGVSTPSATTVEDDPTSHIPIDRP